MKKIIFFILVLFAISTTNVYSQIPDSLFVDTTFVLKVDCSKTYEQMVSDGNYNGKNDYVNKKNFPLTTECAGKTINVIAKIFNFNENISSADIIEIMNNNCFRPANLLELLALGETNPEIQISIVALGSICYIPYKNDATEYICYVPYLNLDPSDMGRIIGIIDFEGNWNNNFHFLGIHK